MIRGCHTDNVWLTVRSLRDETVLSQSAQECEERGSVQIILDEYREVDLEDGYQVQAHDLSFRKIGRYDRRP